MRASVGSDEDRIFVLHIGVDDMADRIARVTYG